MKGLHYMKKTWIKSISLSLAFLLGFGVLATTFAVASKENAPVEVDAATTTTATLTYSDVLAHARSDYKKTEWGDWQWWKVIKSSGDIVAGDNTYFVNNKAYTDGATKIDFSISFKDGYVIPRIEMVAVTLARNSNSFSWTIEDDYYNQNPPYKVYFEDTTSGERHKIESMTLTYTFTKYTVSLNSNGGTGGLSSVNVPYNRAMPTISSSNLPTRNGYVFQGYYDTNADTGGNKYYNANGTSAKTFTNKNDSLKLYARWTLAQKPVNITKGTGLSDVYVSSNGNVTSASSSDLKSSGTNFAQNSTVYGYVKLAAGYQAQSGWTLKAGTADTQGALYLVGSGTVSSSGYDFGTLNASTITYSIDYELNGGSVATANPTSYTIESDTFTLNNPTKEGYNFLGWSEEGKSGYKETVTITKGTYGNKKYTANWELVEELQAVVDAINDLGGPTNISYPGSKTGLENAEGLYNALNPTLKSILDTDYADLVEELGDDREAYDSLRNEAINNAIGKIDAIDETVSYPGSRDVIFAARDAINALADEDKNNTIVTNLDNYNNALDTYNALRDAAVEAVIEAIDNIDRDSEEHVIYPSSQASIENARTLYEALAPEEKEPSTAVTNYGELTQAESDYASLRNDAIGEVIAAINAINKPFDENRESQISNAQNLYDALAESDKDPTYVTNYSRLVDAHAADDVADAIEALPTVADTDEYRALVSGIREQYEALSDEQEAFIPRTSDIYLPLVEKEEAIKVINAINAIGDVSYPGSEALINAANLAYENYINSGYNSDYIVNYDVLVKANDDFYNADNVAKLIEAIPAPAENQSYYDAVDIARAAYNALEGDEQQILIKAIFDPVTNMTYAEYLLNQGLARDVIEKIDDINDVTYNAGVGDSLDDIIAAETTYNAIKDNEYVKGIVDSINYQTLVDDRTIYDHVDEVADLISALAPAADQSYYDAVDAAAAAYDNLTDKEQAIIDAATNVDYEKELADHVAAKEVIEAIDEIGTLTYDGGVNDSLSDIVAAEDAYDAIKDNADVKAIVDSVNYQTLVDDRESYNEVDHTVSLINAIGEIKNDEETKQDLEEAWEAYNALSPEEQALVQGYNNTYKTLDDDQHVYDTLVAIDNIGTVSYDSESEEKIAIARELYDSLTEDQKEQLGKEPLVILVNSETEYARIEKNANILVIILLIVICLTILGGIWFLFFLLKKKRKDDDNNDENKEKGKPVKAMSIGGFLPGVTLISHYLDAPYIALYVLAGVTVLLWISILVVVIMKKKQVGPFKKKAEVAKVEPQASVSQNEDEEAETISDEEGNVFQIRYIKSFTAKLIQSPEETKKYYEELKNEVLSYKKTNSRISWHYDAVNSSREFVLKFAIRGKTLCVYLPLDPEKQEEKYKVEKVESKRFEDIPCLYRIKNDRRCEYAKELVAKVCESMGLEKGKEQHEVYSNIPYEPNKPLVARGLIKEQKVVVSKPAEPVVLETKVNSDGDEVVLTKDASGNIFEIRYIKSFTAKISQSEDVVKDYYTVLKNHVLSYKDTHSRVSWHYDAVNIGRDYVLKFAIRGKTLCVFYALDASKVDEKYKVEVAKGKRFEDVPCLYRIKNDRRCQYAKELIDMLMRKLKVKQGEIPIEDYHIKKESTKVLLAKGLIKETKTKVVDKKVEEHYASISVTQADEVMSDEKAEALIEEDVVSKKREGKKEVVNIDTLSQNYNDGDVVTLDSLIEKKLVSPKAGYVKVLARGVLDKKLTVDLHDYSLQAVKMIVLMGGHAKKIK